MFLLVWIVKFLISKEPKLNDYLFHLVCTFIILRQTLFRLLTMYFPSFKWYHCWTEDVRFLLIFSYFLSRKLSVVWKYLARYKQLMHTLNGLISFIVRHYDEITFIIGHVMWPPTTSIKTEYFVDGFLFDDELMTLF